MGVERRDKGSALFHIISSGKNHFFRKYGQFTAAYDYAWVLISMCLVPVRCTRVLFK